MSTYICKCGRQVAKSINADNTGNRDTAGCEGCPYLLPWGPTAWDDTRHAVVTDIKGYECRMSPELSYITELWGCVDDKCTMQINSLDFDFLERVSAWIKEHYPNGELSGGFSRAKMRSCEFVSQGRYRMSICCAQNKAGMAAKAALVAAFFDPTSKTRLDIDPGAEKQLILDAIETGKVAARQGGQKKEINMEVTYKGPTGWLYRVSERPDAEGLYYMEYRDSATSAVYKLLPGYDRSTNRAEVAGWLSDLAKDRGLVAEEEPAAPEKPKGTGVWLYGDHRAMRVGIGNDTDRSDCRYYHVLVLNLLADKPQWRKLSGAGNYDHRNLTDADEELRETLPEDAHELTMTEAERLFTSSSTGLFELKPHAVKEWDEIMATAAPEPVSSPAMSEPQKCRYAGAFVKDGLECLCDPAQRATIAKVKPGDDVQCLISGPAPDCRAYYAGRIINDEGMDIWKSMNHNSTAQLKEYVAQMDAAETQGPEQREVAAAEMDGNAAICREGPDLVVKSAESPASAPTADIAAPGFDFSALGDLAEQAAEDDAQFNLHYGRAQDEYLISCVYLARIHDLTAKAGRYGGGTWTTWYQSKGISAGNAQNMIVVGDGFKSSRREDLKNLPALTRKDLRLIAGTGTAEAVVEASKTGDDAKVQELLAQLKATEQAKAEAERRAHNLENQNQSLLHSYESEKGKTEKAEREKQEALAWKQHAEGQAEDAKAAIHAAQQTAQEAQRQARQAEAKVEHQESMLAELQDRLDEATGQLRAGVGTVTAEMVDQDELERRAQELADQKIAEALSTQERQPLCDLAITLNNTIKSAWSLSGIDGREPESEDDATALEVLYGTLCQIAEWAEERLDPDVYEQVEATAT